MYINKERLCVIVYERVCVSVGTYVCVCRCVSLTTCVCVCVCVCVCSLLYVCPRLFVSVPLDCF